MPYQVFSPFLDVYGGPFLIVLFGLLLLLESRYPLRRWTQGNLGRTVLNAIVSVPALLILRLGLIPAELAAAYWAKHNHFGVLNLFEMPAWLHGALSFVFLDYVLYIWHILTHCVPLLWRFHNVHHTDFDLSASTALRFHFGEMFLSALFRAGAVLVFGAGALAVLIYEVVFEASVAFQHSNWRLPLWLDRALTCIITTPRMHGIHHSNVPNETNSNFTNLFSIWDRLHGTLQLNVPQDRITIGVPEYSDPRQLTVLKLLRLPFQRQKNY